MAGRVALKALRRPPRLLAGADVALDGASCLAYAGVIVYTYPDLREVERRWAEAALEFPYIPGLLAFREAPALLAALERLECEPDVVFFDGQGLAHPRRLGIASHLGLFLNRPTVGCAKSRLVGAYREPGPRFGDRAPLRDGRQVVGSVIRTRPGTRPIFVSPGHLIDAEGAARLALSCCDGFRIPKPTREADRFVAELKRTKI